MQLHSAGHVLCMVPVVIVSLGGVVAVTDIAEQKLLDWCCASFGRCFTLHFHR